MEWQVGQWVEWQKKIVKLTELQAADGVVGFDVNGAFMWAKEESVKPFIWQVGETYETTLEGVTATIEYISEGGHLVGPASNDEDDEGWAWSPTTGLLRNMESDQTVPHLLPFLADEPSDDPTLTERYTVGQLGTLWGVFDRLTNQFARCENRELSEAMLRDIGRQELDLDWWLVTEEDLPGGPKVAQPKSRYHRTIKGVTIDLYDIAKAYGIEDHAQFHAMKKIIMAGNRGYKSREQDLAEAEQSIQRARELAKGGE